MSRSYRRAGVARNERLTGKFSMGYSTFCEPALHGEMCQNDTDREQRFITVMFDRVSVAFGEGYPKRLPNSAKTL